MPRHSRSLPFKPSVLGCAVAASLLAAPVQALDLCSGKSAITISGAQPGDACTVDTGAASLVVPVGQTLGLGVEVTPGDVTVSNDGTIRHDHVMHRSASSLDEFHSMAALHIDNIVAATVTNTGTIGVNLDLAAHATGTSTTGMGYYNARLFAAAAAVDVTGGVTGQVVNSGTISATIDASVDAASGSASGVALAAGLRVRGGVAGSVVNNGEITASTSLHLVGDPAYDSPSGQAWAVAMGAEGSVSGTLANNGRLIARADMNEGNEGHIRAIGLLAGSGVTGLVENTNSIEVRGDLHDAHDYLAGLMVGFDSQPPGLAPVSGVGVVANSGRISLVMEGDGQGSLHGVVLDRITDNGRFENSATGLISLTGGMNAHLGGVEIQSMAVDALATNAGLIRLTGAPVGEGIDLHSMADNSRFENSGRIEVSLVQEFGALGRGISIGAMTASADVSNSGDVAVTALTKLNSADAVAVQVINVGAGTTIGNSGNLRAEAGVQYAGVARAIGVEVGQLDGSLDNLAGGTITARVVSPSLGTYPEIPDYYTPPGFLSGSALAISVAGGSGVVTNSGVIDGGVLLEGAVSLENNGRLQLPLGSGAVVGGDYVQGEGGVLQVTVRDTASYSGLGVTGAADFSAGGRLEVQLDPLMALADADRVEDIIVAGDLVTSVGGLTVSDSSLFWSFDASLDGNTVDLVAHLADPGAVLAGAGGLSPEQITFAGELLAGNLDPDFAPLLDALNSAPDAEAAADIIESAGPAVTGAAGFAARSALQGASAAVSARLAAMRGENSGDAFSRNAVWIKPYLGMAEQDSVNGIDGYDVATGGFILGVDGDVSDSWRLGVAIAAAQTEVEAEKADLDVDSVVLSLYGSHALNETAVLDLDASHVGNGFDSSRRIAAAGSTARAGYDGRQLALGARMSSRVDMGGKAVFVPSAQVRYNRFTLDGYTETGAGALNLAVAQQTETSLQWLAGAGFEFGVGAGTMTVNAGAGYDTLDAGLATASFAGGGPLYVSNGIKPDATVLTGGLGYRYVTAKSLEINAAYDVESRGSDYMAQTLSVKFRLPF